MQNCTKKANQTCRKLAMLNGEPTIKFEGLLDFDSTCTCIESQTRRIRKKWLSINQKSQPRNEQDGTIPTWQHVEDTKPFLDALLSISCTMLVHSANCLFSFLSSYRISMALVILASLAISLMFSAPET